MAFEETNSLLPGQHLAAIDIGTHSFHLVVVKIKEPNRFEIITQDKEVVRLGSGSSDMKMLKPDAMERGINTLRRFRQIAEISQAPIRAVATSAVREALNKDDFIRRASEEAGVVIQVISGFEEARLIYLGVLQALPIFDKKILLIDIGGGSTEFLIGKEGEVIEANSLKIGAIRMTNRFLGDDPIDPKSVKQCRQYVKAYLNPMTREVRKHGFEVAVGSSGTILNIAQMIQVMRQETPTRHLSNFLFTRSELAEVVKTLVKADTFKKRQKIEGLDTERADIILGGAIILEQAFEEMRIEELTVSSFALREGVIFDTLQMARKGAIHHLSDIRYKGVIHLAESCSYEKDHADQVTRLSQMLYDQLADRLQLEDVNREYLEAASLLHNVGFFISHSQHHRHSYYLIRNSEYLTGFTDREIEIIAQTARYHRKSNPKQKHEEFARLSSEDQKIVRKLASILRITDPLNRTRAGLVRRIQCESVDNTLLIHLDVIPGSDPSLELFSAESRKDLLEEVLGMKVEFIAHGATIEAPVIPTLSEGQAGASGG
jgi:exopolyphosphatase/guanosine-5'-triphosphate,3'-diphosphate pyrophosphatase